MGSVIESGAFCDLGALPMMPFQSSPNFIGIHYLNARPVEHAPPPPVAPLTNVIYFLKYGIYKREANETHHYKRSKAHNNNQHRHLIIVTTSLKWI